jgi:uncharacterized protein
MLFDDATQADHDPAAPLLRQARTIAVVGASLEPWRPSFGVTAYMRRAGYRIVPVNPSYAGETLHGETFRASLRDLATKVDLVNVFRRSDFIPDVVEDCLAIGAPALWLQLGIHHPAAVERARAGGMVVVTDRCISIEHRRLAA